MAQGTDELLAYVANAGDPSISVLALTRTTGRLALIDKTAIPDLLPSPGSMPIALTADRRFLVAALRSEPFAAVSFAIDAATGRLSYLDRAPLAAGMAYATVDKSGRWLLCASDPGGKLTVNPIDAAGRVQAPPVQVIADRPKAHCVVVDAANKHAYCAVMAQDRILQFNFDATGGKLSPCGAGEVRTRAGSGPRHLAFHPNGRFLYLITETTAAIGAYAVDPDSGALRELQFVGMLASSYRGEAAAADLRVTPDGRFLYASERRSNSLFGFRVDPDKGTLAPVGHWPTETTPRGIAIAPGGQFLLSLGLDSSHMTVYAIHPASGALAPVAQHATGKLPNWIEIVDPA